MQTDRADVPALRGAVAELAADCLEALLAEVQDPVLRDRLLALPALVRTALLDGPGALAAGRRVTQELRDLEAIAAPLAPSLADEVKMFREALALMRDDLATGMP